MADGRILQRVEEYVAERLRTYQIAPPPDDRESVLLRASIANGNNPRVAIGDFNGVGRTDVAVILREKDANASGMGKLVALLDDGKGGFDECTILQSIRTGSSLVVAVPFKRMLEDFDEMMGLVRRFRRNPPPRPPTELEGRHCIYFGHYESCRAVFYSSVRSEFVQAPFF